MASKNLEMHRTFLVVDTFPILASIVRLSASVPALGRTRHPFAVSGSEEPSQKIEYVFSASPETIRREPRKAVSFAQSAIGRTRQSAF